MPVEVRVGQLWEFTSSGGHVRRARVLRITAPFDGGIRYVFLTVLGSGRSMRSPLHRMQQERAGARLVEDAPPEEHGPEEDRPIVPEKVTAPRATIHEPRMGAADRRAAVARAQRLHARGVPVDQIAEILCVTAPVVQIWLAEPLEST